MSEQGGGWNPAEAGRRAAEEAKRLAASGNPFLNRAAIPTQPMPWIPGQGIPVEQQLDAQSRQAVAWVVGSLAAAGMAIPPASYLERATWEAQVTCVAEQLYQQAVAAGQSPTWSPSVVARRASDWCVKEAGRLAELAAQAERNRLAQEKRQNDMRAKQEEINVRWRRLSIQSGYSVEQLAQVGQTPEEAAAWLQSQEDTRRAGEDARRSEANQRVFTYGLAFVGALGAGFKFAQERQVEARRKAVRNGQIVDEPYVRREQGFNVPAAVGVGVALFMVGRVIAPWVIDHRSALEAAARTGKVLGL